MSNPKMPISVVLLVTAVLVNNALFAASPAQDVNVVDTPDVNVANTPDVNVTLTPYSEIVVCESNTPITALCYFDVPAGKILKIEKVSGVLRLGNINYLILQSKVGDSVQATSHFIPTVTGPHGGSDNFIYEASGLAYAKDSDWITDGQGKSRDFRVVINTNPGSTTGVVGRCSVIGQLFPDT